MKPTSLFVALVTVLFLAASPQASEKPAKEPSDSSKPTTKEPVPETSPPPVKKVAADKATPAAKKKPTPEGATPPVKKVVADGTTPPVKKKPASEGSTPPVKKVAAAGTTPPVKKKPAPEGSTPPVKKVIADGATPPVKKKPGAPAAKDEFASVLERCDENRDHAVTLAEFQRNQPEGKDAAAVEKWFQTRDSNRDGKLSKEDFKPATSKKS